MSTLQFKSEQPTWCPGCGHYGTLLALKRACSLLNLKPKDIVVVSGIGNSGKISSYFNSFGFHVLHGRTLPVATGIKLVYPKLTVIAVGGDGDGYAIGLSHLIHAIRRNVDITYIVQDNRVYGLTAGQYSPTSERGFKSKTSPRGTFEDPINPLSLALSQGISFLAQGFSGDVKQLEKIIAEAIKHKGFSLINVLSPCPTFNKVNTYEWYRKNIKKIEEDHNVEDIYEAFRKVTSGKIYTGIIYKRRRETLEEVLKAEPLKVKTEKERILKLLEKFS